MLPLTPPVGSRSTFTLLVVTWISSQRTGHAQRTNKIEAGYGGWGVFFEEGVFTTHHPSLSKKYDVETIQLCCDRWGQSDCCHLFRRGHRQNELAESMWTDTTALSIAPHQWGMIWAAGHHDLVTMLHVWPTPSRALWRLTDLTT
jgi:hypothetical protein